MCTFYTEFASGASELKSKLRSQKLRNSAEVRSKHRNKIAAKWHFCGVAE
jgi:hypothetical protein